MVERKESSRGYPRSGQVSQVHNTSAASMRKKSGAGGTLTDSMQRMQISQRSDNFTYNADKVIDKGTFGVVYQATIAETGETVAIKKVLQDRRYKNRELQIMKELSHPNVITLRHAFYTTGNNSDELYLNVVMDYMPDTVYRVVRHYSKMHQRMPMLLVKLYAYQLMRGIGYVHATGICHRDIKPQNLLVDTTRHNLKICDLGSAKKLIRGEPNVSYICSRYYRAPELIFGATEYDTRIDVWSNGCGIGEMILGQPMFPGESGVDQLVEIIKILGTPTREQILAMNPNYTEFKFPQIKPHTCERLFRNKAPAEAIDFVSSLLVYVPSQRPKPYESLLHPFFDELRDPNTRLLNGAPLPELFTWTQQELTYLPPDLVARLTPEWVIRMQATA